MMINQDKNNKQFINKEYIFNYITVRNTLKRNKIHKQHF